MSHSLQLVRFFPLPNDVREINSGAVWLTPWHFLFFTNVAMDFSKKSIETILPHALSRQRGGNSKTAIRWSQIFILTIYVYEQAILTDTE